MSVVTKWEDHEVIFEKMRESLSDYGVCSVSSVDREMIRLASTGNVSALHSRAFESARVPSDDQADCSMARRIVYQMWEDEIRSETSRGNVTLATIEGRNVVVKCLAPYDPDPDPSRPFEKYGKSEDSILEPTILSVMTACRIANVNPFVPITYGSYPCEFAISDAARTRSLIGIAFSQEHIEGDASFLNELIERDIVSSFHTVSLVSCAVFMCTHICGIVHNDLHHENVRYRLLPDPSVTVSHLGATYEFRTNMLPTIIDWGRACSKYVTGACSVDITEHPRFKTEGANIHDIDFGDFLRSVSIMDTKYTALERVLDMARAAGRATTIEHLQSAVAMLHMFVCAWSVFAASKDGFELYPPLEKMLAPSSTSVGIFDADTMFRMSSSRRMGRIFSHSADMAPMLLALMPPASGSSASTIRLNPFSDDDVAATGAYDDDIGVRNKLGETPLHIAIHQRDKYAFSTLIARGADIEARDKNGKTPLHVACWEKSVDAVKLLLDRGANIEARDAAGNRPIHLALVFYDYSVMDALMEKGADISAPNNVGYTPLHVAAKSGNDLMVDGLLGIGAEVDAADENGQTPLHLAAMSNYDATIDMLVKKGAAIESKDKMGMTPLHVATRNESNKCVRALIALGANINARTVSDKTPLHFAAIKNNVIAARLCAEHASVEIDARDRAGLTPLHTAAIQNFEEIARLLIENGANVDLVSNLKNTPLHSAVSHGNRDIAGLLMDNGADIEAVNLHGYTPLHVAIHKGLADIVLDLIARGADIHTPQTSGRTPLQIAVDNGHDDIARELVRRGARAEPAGDAEPRSYPDHKREPTHDAQQQQPSPTKRLRI
jgi:ankyrin repeat protein